MQPPSQQSGGALQDLGGFDEGAFLFPGFSGPAGVRGPEAPGWDLCFGNPSP